MGRPEPFRCALFGESRAYAPPPKGGKSGRQSVANATNAAQRETDGRIPIGVLIPEIFIMGDKYLKKPIFRPP
jgi:hypothetical protein